MSASNDKSPYSPCGNEDDDENGITAKQQQQEQDQQTQARGKWVLLVAACFQALTASMFSLVAEC